jgi:hypothetical protein
VAKPADVAQTPVPAVSRNLVPVGASPVHVARTLVSAVSGLIPTLFRTARHRRPNARFFVPFPSTCGADTRVCRVGTHPDTFPHGSPSTQERKVLCTVSQCMWRGHSCLPCRDSSRHFSAWPVIDAGTQNLYTVQT